MKNPPYHSCTGDREDLLPIKRADEGTRTHNRPLTKRLLYRLSYVGALEILLPGARHYTKSGGWGQGFCEECFCEEQDQSSAVTKGRRPVRAGQHGSPQNPALARPGIRPLSLLLQRSMIPLFRA